jgi:hypothetical protein
MVQETICFPKKGKKGLAATRKTGAVFFDPSPSLVSLKFGFKMSIVLSVAFMFGSMHDILLTHLKNAQLTEGDVL